MRLLIGIGASIALTFSAAAQDLSCTQRGCKQMGNCREAVWRFDYCSASNLDRDNDGLPGENLCRTADDVSQARAANAAARPELPIDGSGTGAGGENAGADNGSGHRALRLRCAASILKKYKLKFLYDRNRSQYIS
ncbi:hypothetical protein [Labrys monachus]|uniref:Uncharacterized protein n=1 Tax=Labrys monachus TaxID=217067 RepID=A0ABU0FJY6_9HYPH|nr:hypothetical protein [Labrys monachus]MDQ0394836.1 hypothetical protein [Labrys monachus]